MIAARPNPLQGPNGALLIAASLASAVALGVGVVRFGITIAVAPLVVASAVVSLRYPKLAIVSAVVAVFFSRLLGVVAPQFDSLDEVLIACLAAITALRIAGGAPIYKVPGGFAALAFLLLAAVGALNNGIGVKLGVLDAYLVMKGFLLYAVVCQYSWTVADVRRGAKVGVWVSIVAFALILANLAIGAPWYALFANHGWVVSRGGIDVPVGPFGHPGAAGQALALIAAAAVAFGIAIGHNRWSWSVLLISVPLTLMTLRRKAILGLVGAVAAAVSIDRSARRRALPVLVVALVGILAVTGRDVVNAYHATYDEYVRDASDAPRTMLYRASFDLANDRFPIGAGLGRFGTSVAFENYSPIYYQLGFDKYYGFRPKTGNFATDTYWPGIIGEGGWFGLIAVAAALALAARPCLRLVRTRISPEHRFVGLVGVAWSVEFALESFAAPVYNTAPLYPLLFLALGVGAALDRSDIRSIGALQSK